MFFFLSFVAISLIAQDTIYCSNGQMEVGRLNEFGKKTGEWTHYMSDGRVWQILNYKNDTLNGRSQEFAGEQITVGSYTNGKKNGTWKYSISGCVFKTENYMYGQKSGEWNEFYCPEGQINILENYENDRLNGEFRVYTLTGQTVTQGSYIRGNRTGAWKEFSENGELKKITLYDPKSNSPAQTEYYYLGRLSHIEKIEGRIVSKEIYYESGQLAEITHKEILGGEMIFHGCSNGGDYEPRSRIVGTWKTFYENGQLKQTSKFLNNGRPRKYRSYYENGCLMEKGRFDEHGDCVGVWKTYDKNGRLLSFQDYDSDE